MGSLKGFNVAVEKQAKCSEQTNHLLEATKAKAKAVICVYFNA